MSTVTTGNQRGRESAAAAPVIDRTALIALTVGAAIIGVGVLVASFGGDEAPARAPAAQTRPALPTFDTLAGEWEIADVDFEDFAIPTDSLQRLVLQADGRFEMHTLTLPPDDERMRDAALLWAPGRTFTTSVDRAGLRSECRGTWRDEQLPGFRGRQLRLTFERSVSDPAPLSIVLDCELSDGGRSLVLRGNPLLLDVIRTRYRRYVPPASQD
jgi:hypothetical protein